MEQQSLSEQIKQLIEEIKVYVNLRISYLRLHVAEFLIRFFSGLVLWMVIFLFLFFVLVFGSFAFAYWFAEITGKMSLGFLIIAGFYILVAALIFAFRRQLIVKPFTKLIISQMDFDKIKDQEDGKEEQ
jgi:signal transduction histidine kinase